MNQLATIDSMMTDAKGFVTATIQQYQWSIVPESQLHAAKAALTKSDYIEKIALSDPEAVREALTKGAILGVDLTESKRQAYLVPRKNAKGKTVIQLQVGYKGVEAIHQRMGVIDRLTIRVVYKNDTFDWSGDDAEKPKHEAEWFSSDRGGIEGAYCVTYFPDKSIQVVTAPISEIYEKHRDISDSWKQYKRKVDANERAYPPPWVTHEKAMIEKTMAYIASKQWPANIRNEDTTGRILETLHDVDTADYREAFTRYSAEEKSIFMEILENDDCLGMYLLHKHYTDMENQNHEAWTDLNGSYIKGIARGGKGKERDRISGLIETGEDVFRTIIETIDNDDSFGLMENVEDVTAFTKKLLWNGLTTDHQNKMRIMLDGD